MNRQKKIIFYGLIPFFIFSCSSSKNITGEYFCFFCPKGFITYSVDLQTGCIGIINTKIIRTPSIIDTVSWFVNGNTVYLKGIDTVKYTSYIKIDQIFPSQLLYSNNYILMTKDSTRVLLYKNDEESKGKNEFYYWEMIHSGRQDSIIKANFGDSLEIVKNLR